MTTLEQLAAEVHAIFYDDVPRLEYEDLARLEALIAVIDAHGRRSERMEFAVDKAIAMLGRAGFVGFVLEIDDVIAVLESAKKR